MPFISTNTWVLKIIDGTLSHRMKALGGYALYDEAFAGARRLRRLSKAARLLLEKGANRTLPTPIGPLLELDLHLREGGGVRALASRSRHPFAAARRRLANHRASSVGSVARWRRRSQHPRPKPQERARAEGARGGRRRGGAPRGRAARRCRRGTRRRARRRRTREAGGALDEIGVKGRLARVRARGAARRAREVHHRRRRRRRASPARRPPRRGARILARPSAPTLTKSSPADIRFTRRVGRSSSRICRNSSRSARSSSDGAARRASPACARAPAAAAPRPGDCGGGGAAVPRGAAAAPAAARRAPRWCAQHGEERPARRRRAPSRRRRRSSPRRPERRRRRGPSPAAVARSRGRTAAGWRGCRACGRRTGGTTGRRRASARAAEAAGPPPSGRRPSKRRWYLPRRNSVAVALLQCDAQALSKRSGASVRQEPSARDCSIIVACVGGQRVASASEVADATFLLATRPGARAPCHEFRTNSAGRVVRSPPSPAAPPAPLNLRP